MTLQFSSGFQNTLPNCSFAGIVVKQHILPNIFFGKCQIRCVEKLFQQRVSAGTENMRLIVPKNDSVFAKVARNRYILFDRHQFDNRVIEAVNETLQHAAKRNFFGKGGHNGHDSWGDKNQG